jgi:methyl-accepting chemotaxis protein
MTWLRTYSIEQTAVIVSDRLNELNENIEDTSANVEELAAGMEETAAAAEQVNASSSEIETAIETMAQKAQQGAIAAGEISDRADKLKNNAKTSQDTARDVYAVTKSKLEGALEQSKSIEQINVLSNAILQISSFVNKSFFCIKLISLSGMQYLHLKLHLSVTDIRK